MSTVILCCSILIIVITLPAFSTVRAQSFSSGPGLIDSCAYTLCAHASLILELMDSCAYAVYYTVRVQYCARGDWIPELIDSCAYAPCANGCIRRRIDNFAQY